MRGREQTFILRSSFTHCRLGVLVTQHSFNKVPDKGIKHARIWFQYSISIPSTFPIMPFGGVPLIYLRLFVRQRIKRRITPSHLHNNKKHNQRAAPFNPLRQGCTCLNILKYSAHYHQESRQDSSHNFHQWKVVLWSVAPFTNLNREDLKMRWRRARMAER